MNRVFHINVAATALQVLQRSTASLPHVSAEVFIAGAATPALLCIACTAASLGAALVVLLCFWCWPGKGDEDFNQDWVVWMCDLYVGLR